MCLSLSLQNLKMWWKNQDCFTKYTKFNFKHLAPDLQFDIIVSESRTGEFGTNFETPDAYMEFRTAFSCDNLEQMIFHFEMNNEPFLFLDERMYVKTPSGKIFEIYEE